MRLTFSSTTAPRAFAAAIRDVLPNLPVESCLEWAARLLAYSSWAELQNSVCVDHKESVNIATLAPHGFREQFADGSGGRFGGYNADPFQLRTLVELCNDEFGEVACDELLAAMFARYLVGPVQTSEEANGLTNPFHNALLSHWFFTEKKGEALSSLDFQRALLAEEQDSDTLCTFRIKEGFRTRAQANAWFANATALPLHTLDYMRKDDALVLTSWGDVHAVGPRVREGYNRGKHPVSVQDSLARLWVQDPSHRMRAGFALDMALIADKNSSDHDCLSIYVHFAWCKSDAYARKALLSLAPTIVGEELIRPFAQRFLWTRVGLREPKGRIRFLHDDEPLAIELAEALKASVDGALKESYGCHCVSKYMEPHAEPRRTFSCY